MESGGEQGGLCFFPKTSHSSFELCSQVEQKGEGCPQRERAEERDKTTEM